MPLVGGGSPNTIRRRLWGKHEVLRFVLKELAQAMMTADALQRALKHVRTVSPLANKCLKDNFKAYRRSLTVPDAMSRAFDACLPRFPAAHGRRPH